MPKRPRSFPTVVTSGCLTGFLFLVGGLTIGVDLFLFTSPSPSINTQSRSFRANIKQGPAHGPEIILRKPQVPPNLSDGPRLATAANNKEPVLRILEEAGFSDLDVGTVQKLPTFQQVIDVWGTDPIIYGLDSCQKYRDRVPEVRRMLGPAGMFSTGTNLVTHLLKQNCLIPARVEAYGLDASKEQLGMRWQVPWGKHTDPAFREKHATEHAQSINKDDLLPVVTIRNVWTWMQSMCRNPYSARWQHWEQCPNLRLHSKPTEPWNNVTVTYGAGKVSYKSLLHLWNDWYHAYVKNATYPLLMIRMEDLVFHTKSTIAQVCECVGGQLREDRAFQYIQESAKKDSPGHDTRTGYVEAWIKYSKSLQPQAGFAPEDYQATIDGVNQRLMSMFRYPYPPPG